MNTLGVSCIFRYGVKPFRKVSVIRLEWGFTPFARDLGIASGNETAMMGAELDMMSDEELRTRAPETAVYARVTAEHKLRIIRAWKASGAVVAAAGAIPLVVLELVKVVRNRKRDASPDAQAMKTG